jgi:hypothetical protein
MRMAGRMHPATMGTVLPATAVLVPAVTVPVSAISVTVLVGALFAIAILGHHRDHAHPRLDGRLEVVSLPLGGSHRGWGDGGRREGGKAADGSRQARHGKHEMAP